MTPPTGWPKLWKSPFTATTQPTRRHIDDVVSRSVGRLGILSWASTTRRSTAAPGAMWVTWASTGPAGFTIFW